jgi:L-rhamnose-H+ transport protein
MTAVVANPLLGILLHAVGAFSAALCYTPQRKLKGWSWQTYWIVQAALCWVLLPIIGALITIPHIATVLSEVPPKAMLLTFALGAAYGVGGTSFGLAIKKIGFSLTYAIAIGISCVLGTLTGPLIKGELGAIMDKPGSGWVMTGVFVGLVGTLMCGLAGRLKEVEMQKETDSDAQPFDLKSGLFLCGIAGILSAVYGIAVNDAGAPISAVAAKYGASYWQTNIVYIFSNTGAFLTTSLYCIHLIRKEGTLKEFLAPSGEGNQGALAKNYFLATLTGIMWYGQFLFYGTAHVRMGAFKFSSWAIHMIMLILLSAMSGVVMREWHGRQLKTKLAITFAVSVLITAVLVLTYGNYIGQQAMAH